MKLKIIKFNSVKSTNNEAIKLIRSGKLILGLVSADTQTNGKGTMGKKWISQKGNIFISIFFKVKKKNINFKHFARLNAYLIQNILSKEILKKIKIKWPNDLLYKKKKICGILQEVVNYKDKKFLIVGIGINTNFDPKNKGFQSTSLKDITNKNIDNKKVINLIKKKYEKFLTKVKIYSYTELKKYTNNL